MSKQSSKLTALALSLAMALSLVLPAGAIQVPAPLKPPSSAVLAEQNTATYLSWDEFLFQYVENHPELYENFDADAWFAAEYPWEDKEEFVQQYMDTADEATFKKYMWTSYLSKLSSYSEAYGDDPLYQEIDAAYGSYLIDVYEARHPGELNKLKTKDLLARYGYTKTLTPTEQFMKAWNLSSKEQVRPMLLSEYTSDRLRAEEHHTLALTYQALYPEQWAGFDADAWFAAEYALWDKAEYINDFTLLTEEEFQENMFVNYVASESWKWTLPWDDNLQSTTLLVNGQPVEADITYVDTAACTDADTLNAILGTSLSGDCLPICQTAETAGWDAVWNPSCRMIALYRQEDLPQGDFAQFDTLMNQLLSTFQAEKGQAYQTTETTTLKFTALNSLDGDKTATARITTELIQKDAHYELTMTINAADLLRLLPKRTLDALNSQLDHTDLSSLLRSCKITLLINAETGDIYLNAPILGLLDDAFPSQSWLRWNAGQSLRLLTDIGRLEWDTNHYLYQTLLRESASSQWGQWIPYASYLQSQNILGGLLAPQYFTQRGGTITWALNAESLRAAFPEELGAAAMSIFKEYEVKLSVDRNGKMTADAAIRLDTDALAQLILENSYDPGFSSSALTSWAVGLFDFRMESHASGNADRSSSTALFHWKNQFKLEITSNSSRQRTSANPKAEPPKGSEILDFS